MKSVLSLLLFAFMFAMPTVAQTIKDDGMGLKYIEQVPMFVNKDTKLIVLVHGRGGDETSLFSKKSVLPENAIVIAPRGPIDMGGTASFGWYNVTNGKEAPEPVEAEAENSRVALAAFIKKMQKKYHINAEKTVVWGFSQGGAMALSMVLTYPDVAKTAVNTSGRILDQFVPKFQPKTVLEHVIVFSGHGTNDKLLPVKFAKNNKETLAKKGVNIELHEYPIGHELSEAELKDIKEWLKNMPQE